MRTPPANIETPVADPQRFGKRRFTEHEDRVINALLAEGWSHPKIAEALGRVSGPSVRAHTAARRARADDAKKRASTTRPCITCRRPFASSGFGHRMCDDCRRCGENPFDPHSGSESLADERGILSISGRMSAWAAISVAAKTVAALPQCQNKDTEE